MDAQEKKSKGVLVKIFSGWDGDRNDTRVQVGSKFESRFAYIMPLGCIFEDEVEGTIALYQGWNGSRGDTRTQVGPTFESGYSLSGLLGYIYKEKQPGTVPLYSGWSGSRSDTRVQVGDKFESMYGYKTLLGYIYKDEIEVRNVKYDLPHAKETETLLDRIVLKDIPNESTVEQTVTTQVEYTDRKSHTFKWEKSEKWGITIGYSVNAEVGLPMMDVNGAWHIEGSYEKTISSGGEEYVEHEEKKTFTFPVTIPAKSTAKCTSSIFRGEVNVPFTVSLGIKGSKRPEDEWEVPGTCNRVTSYRAEPEYTFTASL